MSAATVRVTPAYVAALDHRATRDGAHAPRQGPQDARTARERPEAAIARRRAATVARTAGPHRAPACRWCGAWDAIAVHGVHLCADCADTIAAQAVSEHRRDAP